MLLQPSGFPILESACSLLSEWADSLQVVLELNSIGQPPRFLIQKNEMGVAHAVSLGNPPPAGRACATDRAIIWIGESCRQSIGLTGRIAAEACTLRVTRCGYELPGSTCDTKILTPARIANCQKPGKPAPLLVSTTKRRTRTIPVDPASQPLRDRQAFDASPAQPRSGCEPPNSGKIWCDCRETLRQH